MGGSSMDDDWETISPKSINTPKSTNTVVLVGRTGNGKSATGNSILGRREFKSRASSSGITTTSELRSTVLKDKRTVNVIDTPGLFEISAGADFIGQEIVKCIELAKEGIHAVLVVFSVRARFSKEEEAALQSLRDFFGHRITDYMIVVFTGGDELEEDGDTLKDYLGRECPEPLQKFLESCDNRVVLFDNKTKDVNKKMQQVQQLISIVDLVMEKNKGQPYSDEIFAELKMENLNLQNQKKQVESLEGYSKQELSSFKESMQKTYDDQLKRITKMVELKLWETTQKLEKQLKAEQAAREAAETLARKAHEKSNEEIRHLRENLEKARQETEDLRRQAQQGKCAIL